MIYVWKTVFLLISCLVTLPLCAQQRANSPAPAGKFIDRKAKVGQPVRYSLSLTHPAAMEVFFPDSAHTFSPFEFVSKQYFPTRTVNGQSTDSVVYELSTFEVEAVQGLSLPVFALKGKDTLVLESNTDSLQIEATVTELPQKIQIAESLELQKVDDQFNYPYLLIGVGAVLLTGIAVFYAFGGRIRKAYRLRRLRRQYERFSSDYEKTLSQQQNIATTENGLGLWKSYLENLLNAPFTSYTSKEIAGIIPDEKLNMALKNIDVAIYGNRINEQTRQSLEILKAFALNTYNEKVKEVRNA